MDEEQGRERKNEREDRRWRGVGGTVGEREPLVAGSITVNDRARGPIMSRYGRGLAVVPLC